MKNLNIKKNLMTAISYLIPFVCCAGMLMVVGNILGGQSIKDFSGNTSIADVLFTLGGDGLGLLSVFISMFIAYAIADRTGIVPGFLCGVLCKEYGYGFLGGLLAGFLAGYLAVYLKTAIKLPAWFEGIKPMLILPFLTTLIIGLIMRYIIGIPIHALQEFINYALTTLQGGSVLILGLVVGILSAVDYGGPINKVVFVFCLGLMSEGYTTPMNALISASMIAPLGLTICYFLSRAVKRDIFSGDEANALKSAFIMGCCQITEGSYPIILNDLARITICTAIGAAVNGALVFYWECTNPIVWGGFFTIPGQNQPGLWTAALLIGSFIFAVCCLFLKRKPAAKTTETEEEQDLDLSNVKISG
ncbi:PTS fructose transporter subunit IIC [Pectinatus haikarae]|uniref:PTS system fructose-specific IIC component n=1 Tax=Pectinatus haikarae TaxID=349096 RepID=A0ABT9Y7W2_9FIRM|nr:PTS fructose transporter subunit IIC [Pectinatus haikarae]MDQ0203931.1 PTS system fructose-specific IIC component [Pectinatus haikarae]